MSKYKETHVWSPEEQLYVERLVEVPEPSKERPYEDKVAHFGCPTSTMLRGHTHYVSMTMKEFNDGNHICEKCGSKLVFEEMLIE